MAGEDDDLGEGDRLRARVGTLVGDEDERGEETDRQSWGRRRQEGRGGEVR
jgi:hypothetical protein